MKKVKLKATSDLTELEYELTDNSKFVESLIQESAGKNSINLVILQQSVLRIVVLLLLAVAIRFVQDPKIDINSFSFLLFVLSGVVNGLNYGFNNHNFLHENKESLNLLHRSHIIWEHIISGIVSSIIAYLLTIKFKFGLKPELNLNLSGVDFILLSITLLGYCGFIPMIMWFFSHSIELLQDFIKKM